MTLLMKLLMVVIVAVLTVVVNNFKRPPEKIQKDEDNAKNKDYIDRVNAGSPGYELPPEAVNDKWGASITEVTPRMESDQADGIERKA